MPPDSQTAVYVARNREQLRSVLQVRPDSLTCLLVSSRAASGSNTHLKVAGVTLGHTFNSSHPIAAAINQGQKPSPILVFSLPPDHRSVASCSTLNQDRLTSQQLAMLFKGSSGVIPINCLFDSGATSCFIGQKTCHKLSLSPNYSTLKAVSTAAGKSTAIAGLVTVPVRLGPLSFSIKAHVLPSFLKEADLILGQDFLSANHAVLDYGTAECKIRPPHKEPVTLGKSSPFLNPGASSSNQISAACAARFIKKDPASAFVALIQPLEKITSDQPPWGTASHNQSPPSDPTPGDAPPQQPQPPPPPTLPPVLEKVPPDFRSRVQDLLEEYSDIFSETPKAGGAHVDLPEHTIDLLPGSKVPFRRNRRLSPLELQELRTQVTDLLNKGIITPSNSPFGAPVLFVPKPGGGLRFCLDYRALNQITTKLRYPLPRIDDLLDAARGGKFFSALDMASGYHQIKIAEADVPKTAFSTPFGHYEWRVLPMGLCNAPSSFMRVMNKVFEKYIGDFVLIYLDDILVMSSDPESHFLHLRKVFDTIREHRFQIKLSKSKFFQEQIKYLGHILSAEGIRPDPAKIQTLVDWPYPSDAQGMMQFLGLANYFRKFIPNFSRIAAPLYHLTKKSVPFSKGEEAQLCFRALKQLLTSPPLLAYPDPSQPYELISDASITGCGAVLIQNGRPVAYFSSKYSSTERNYTTGEQEMLGIIKALKEWRCYLEGCQGLTLVTDHNPLTFFSTQPTLSRRQARWNEFLSRFHFSLRHRPGVSNPADPLSRLTHADPNEADLSPSGPEGIATIAILATTVSEFSSDLLSRIRSAYDSDPFFNSSSLTNQYELTDGLWTYKGRIIVPKSIQSELMAEHHSSPVAGHFGWERTLDLISRHFWWPGMRHAVQDYVRSCTSCQVNKSSNRLPYGLLNPLDIPDSRWHTVTMDFIMDLPPSPSGSTAILVFVDKLSKYVHLVPTRKTCTAEECARLFLSNIYQYHGLPKKLISDREPRFTSEFWKAFCRRLGMKPAYSTSFHPQTDGQTERTNRVVEEVLRHFIGKDHQDWEDLLPLVQFAINNSKSSSTGETPFFLNHGTHPATPVTVGLPEGHLPALDAVFSDLDSALIRIQSLLKAAQDRQKSYADQRRAPHSFQTGESVLLSTRNLNFKYGVKKFHPKFIGPFRILKMVGANAAHLELPSSYRIHPVFHVSLLKEYREGSALKSLPPTPEVIDGTPYYKVERILSSRERRSGRRTIREYLIKWEGYDDSHNSWEPEKNLTPDLLKDRW